MDGLTEGDRGKYEGKEKRTAVAYLTAGCRKGGSGDNVRRGVDR